MAGEQNKKRKIPFWLQIVLILALGAAASLVVLLVARSGRQEGEAAAQKNAEMHTVKFCYDDGTVIEEKQARDGEGVFPPEYIGDAVFRGWNNALNNVTEDIEAHPMLYNIVEENLFYFDSAYVQEGEQIALDLYVGGTVRVSAGELTLTFDPEVLTFKKGDDAVPCEFQEDTPGTLKVTFSASEPITEKTKLGSVTLQAAVADAFSTDVLLSAENVTLNSDGNETAVDFATINNKIFFLQEATR